MSGGVFETPGDEFGLPQSELLQHFTAAPTGRFQATHVAGEELGVWLVPLDLRRTIRVRRVSAIISWGAASGAGAWHLGIYRAVLPRQVDKQHPDALILSTQAQLVRYLGGGSTGSDKATRLNVQLGIDLRLDPRSAKYYLGIQVSSASCLWLAPAQTEGVSLFPVYKTRPLGKSAGDFPQALNLTAPLDVLPSIVLRSAVGVRLYGHATGEAASIVVGVSAAGDCGCADMKPSGAGHAHGLAPDPPASAGTSKFLREDATWVAPASGVPTTRRVDTTAPLTGGGDLSADRTLAVSDFVASGASHARGAVPDPGAVAGTSKFLREDATWVAPGASPRLTAVDGNTLIRWSLDELVSPWANTDGAAGSLDLTAQAGTPTLTDGLLDGALYLNVAGPTRLTSGNTNVGNTITQALTVSFWVRLQTIAPGNEYFLKHYYNNNSWTAPYAPFLFQQGNSSGSGTDGRWYIRLATVNGSTVVNCGTSGTGGGGGPAGNVIPGEWTHLALTYDGANLVAYKNGVKLASSGITGDVDWNGSSGGPYFVGGNPPIATASDCAFDDLRVEGVVRSAAYLKALCQKALYGGPGT